METRELQPRSPLMTQIVLIGLQRGAIIFSSRAQLTVVLVIELHSVDMSGKANSMLNILKFANHNVPDNNLSLSNCCPTE